MENTINNSAVKKVAKPQAILLKVLGVTSSIYFEQVMDDYFAEHVESYLEARWGESKTQKIIKRLQADALNASVNSKGNSESVLIPNEKVNNKKEVIKAIVAFIKTHNDNNKAGSAINDLQAYIWHEGFKNGKLHAVMFDDVVPALKRWKEARIQIFTFSSGSVEGQSYYFEYSNQGNISEYISGHISGIKLGIDKHKAESYVRLAKVLGTSKEKVLFLSSSAKEAMAALEAGMMSIVVDRKEKLNNVLLAKKDSANREEVPVVNSFDEIQFQ